MTPLEAPIHACTSRRRSALLGTLIIFAALALLFITELQAQEWRFEAIDQRFNQQERRFEDIDRRFNRLDQQIRRLDGNLWDYRMSQQPLWGTKGVVDALRDIVHRLQEEVAYLRRLIDPPQPSHPPLAGIGALPRRRRLRRPLPGHPHRSQAYRPRVRQRRGLGAHVEGRNLVARRRGHRRLVMTGRRCCPC